MIQLHRRAQLLDAAVVEYGDALAQGHGFGLIVGDVDHRGLELLVQLGQLDAQLHAQRSVQIGQRLVKQKHLGPAHNGPPDRHPLALPARQLLGVSIEQVCDLQGLCGGLHLPGHVGLGGATHAQTKAHVLGNRHVRVQGIALKHHGGPTFGRAAFIDLLAVYQEVSGSDGLQASHHAQHGRFATARWADKDHELAITHIEADVSYDRGWAVAFGNVLESDRCHRLTL